MHNIRDTNYYFICLSSYKYSNLFKIDTTDNYVTYTSKSESLSTF